MRTAVLLTLTLAALLAAPGVPASRAVLAQVIEGADDLLTGEQTSEYVRARRDDDFVALAAARPGYSFWRHIFTIPDGHIAFGSASDGRLLAVFPTRGD
jgi:hypothetical protein